MDEEAYGLEDDLPEWANDDADDVPDDDADLQPDLPADGSAAGTPQPLPPDPNAPQPEPPPIMDKPPLPDPGIGGGTAGIAPLPSGVSLMPQGAAQYFTQRVTAPPMVDCMFAALCTPLAFMGYRLPPTFVGTLREASGVPRINPITNKPQGTSTAATKTALRKLLPEAPVVFGGLADDVMLDKLGAGRISVRVTVGSADLPRHLRRFIGFNWIGGHAIALGGARRRGDGTWEVRWMDPAGRPGTGYDGEFVSYAEVKQALRRTSTGQVRVTYGEFNAALPTRWQQPKQHPQETIVRVLTNGQHDEFSRIGRGTPFLHPETTELVTTAQEDADFRLAGRSLDGRFAGVWVNTGRIPNASGLTLLLVEVSRIGPPFIRA